MSIRKVAFHRGSERGQAMVEFAMTVVIFILLVMGVFDLGRGVFMYNQLSEAARDIARVTSTHPGVTLGTSTETQSVVDAHRDLVPGLTVSPMECVEIDGSAVSGTCLPGDWVKVTVHADYSPITPGLALLIPHLDLQSVSSIQIP